MVFAAAAAAACISSLHQQAIKGHLGPLGVFFLNQHVGEFEAMNNGAFQP